MKTRKYIIYSRDEITVEIVLCQALQWECMSFVADSRKWKTLDEEVRETARIAGKSLMQNSINKWMWCNLCLTMFN